MSNVTTRRYYVNFAPQQQLASGITSGAGSLAVAGSFAGWSVTFPFYAVINYGQADAEIIRIDGITGTTATIGERGSDSSSAQSHSAGATLDACFIRKDMDEANAHSSATDHVHGIAGNVVGDTDAQTLTNKTLTTPVIDDPTVTNGTFTDPVIDGGVLDAASSLGGVTGTTLAAERTGWTSYTPTFTNCTSPVGQFAYKLIGKTLHIRGCFTAGTATVSGNVKVTLPGGMAAAGSGIGLQFIAGIASGSTTDAWVTAAGGTTISSAFSSFGTGQNLAGAGFTGVIEIA